MEFKNAIIHMDLDAFFVSVERLKNSKLNGVPVVIGGSSERGVVSSCSYEARAKGVHSAMPIMRAKQLCPEAIYVSGDLADYTYYSKIVTDIIQSQVPVFEKSSIDEFYIDISGMDRFFGCWKFAKELRRTIIKESGLPISFGLSQNKTTSKIATGEAKPNNEMQVLPGEEKQFLAPLSIKKIPMAGKKTVEKLNQLGLDKIIDIQQIEPEYLEKVLGKSGPILWKKAMGIYESPIVEFRERKSVSKERTFHKDTIDYKYLHSVLILLTESVAHILRKKEMLSSCITLKLRYENFDTFTFQKKISYTAMENHLIPEIIHLFEKNRIPKRKIRLIGVKCSDLITSGFQMQMFDDESEKMKLYDTIDHIKNKYGNKSLLRAASLYKKTK